MLESVYQYQLNNSVISPIQNHVIKTLNLSDHEIDFLMDDGVLTFKSVFNCFWIVGNWQKNHANQVTNPCFQENADANQLRKNSEQNQCTQQKFEDIYK